MTDYFYENITVDIQDGIAWTALNRPEKKNAMSPELHYDMDDAIGRLEMDPAAKVVVIMGTGGNFSSGQDLKKFFREQEDDAYERKRSQRAANSWRWDRLYNYDKPTIAMVEGYCVGGAYGRLLDSESEHLGEATVQAFETEGLIGTGAAPAVLAYLFHRIEARLDG